MITLNKDELVSYKNSLLISFTTDSKFYKWGNQDGLLSNIYTCIIKRKFSGTAQEKVDIALLAKVELAAILNDSK